MRGPREKMGGRPRAKTLWELIPDLFEEYAGTPQTLAGGLAPFGAASQGRSIKDRLRLAGGPKSRD